MDKIKNTFKDVDGLYICWGNDETIKFCYNGEAMCLMKTSPYIYSLSFDGLDLELKEFGDIELIKHRHLIKNGIVYYVELLLRSRYEILEEDYLKVKSIIPSDIIQTSSYEDKMKSKYTFSIKTQNNIHHHDVRDEIKFTLYLDEINMIWVLKYDHGYLYRRINTNNLLKDGISYYFHEIIQRNYEWEYFPDFEDDY